MNDIQKLEAAIFSDLMPCNPIPFLMGLADYVKANGTDSITSDTAKRILWVVLSQSYGQMATVDLVTEYSRLTKVTEVTQ